MKTKTPFRAIIASVLVGSMLVAAEPKEVQKADVPPELLKSASTLSKGAETKFFQHDSVPPRGMWRVEFQESEQKKVYFIETKETVVNGKTNVTVVMAMPLKPKK
jgi:hypothetical protein